MKQLFNMQKKHSLNKFLLTLILVLCLNLIVDCKLKKKIKSKNYFKESSNKFLSLIRDINSKLILNKDSSSYINIVNNMANFNYIKDVLNKLHNYSNIVTTQYRSESSIENHFNDQQTNHNNIKIIKEYIEKYPDLVNHIYLDFYEDIIKHYIYFDNLKKDILFLIKNKNKNKNKDYYNTVKNLFDLFDYVIEEYFEQFNKDNNEYCFNKILFSENNALSKDSLLVLRVNINLQKYFKRSRINQHCKLVLEKSNCKTLYYNNSTILRPYSVFKIKSIDNSNKITYVICLDDTIKIKSTDKINDITDLVNKEN